MTSKYSLIPPPSIASFAAPPYRLLCLLPYIATYPPSPPSIATYPPSLPPFYLLLPSLPSSELG